MKRIYRIDQNIPIPKSRKNKYPWDRMDVGDSFYIPQEVNPDPYGAIYNANKRYRVNGYKFQCKRDQSNYGFRVWRIK